MAVRLVVMAH